MRSVEALSQKLGDDLDGVLHAFYRAEMPNPWPTPCVPISRTAPMGRGSTRSRWALAASAALLLLGSSLLPSRFTSDPKPDQGIGGLGTAGADILPKKPKRRENKPTANENHPGFGIEEGDLLPELDDSDFSWPK